jgi:hypothetical protein
VKNPKMSKIIMGGKLDDSRKLSSRKTRPQRNEYINISTPLGMHLYIYYLYHCHEGNCRTKEPFAEVMDPEGS